MALNTKQWLRIIGTLMGIIGISGLCITAMMLSHEIHQPAVIALAVVMLIIDLFLIYTCYLVWRRFSPRAVRYVCGNLAFIIFCVFNAWFHGTVRNLKIPYEWIPIIFLFFVFALYRVANRRLIHSLFKETA